MSGRKCVIGLDFHTAPPNDVDVLYNIIIDINQQLMSKICLHLHGDLEIV